jgi:uncharacterized membrane protein YfcA
MFQLPAVVLSIVIASICAVLFYIWQGKTPRNLAAYWVGSVLGFWIGQVIAISLDWPFPTLGQVHLIEGIFFSMCALLVVKLLKI